MIKPAPLRSRWIESLLFASLIAVGLAGAFAAARRIDGFDALAYIGAGYQLEDGQPIYTNGFSKTLAAPGGELRSYYFPPFLYHPFVAVVYRRVVIDAGLGVVGGAHATNVANVALLSAGLLALLLAARWPLCAVGLVFALAWWSPVLRYALQLGNLGPAMAGLVLGGAAATLRKRDAAAGALFALACLVKPAIWLVWLVLLLFWRDRDGAGGDARRRKPLLLGAWLGVFAALSLAAGVIAGFGSLADYLECLRAKSANVWSICHLEASAGGFALKWVSPWRPDLYAMLLFGANNLEATIGKFAHPQLFMAKAANLLALVVFMAICVWRRRDLAARPVYLIAAAAITGFIVQPANWSHNYALLILAPLAIAHAGSARGRVALAWALVGYLMLAPILLLVRWDVIPFERTLPTRPTAELLWRWNVARVLASVSTFALAGLVALIFDAARRGGSSRDEAATAGGESGQSAAS